MVLLVGLGWLAYRVVGLYQAAQSPPSAVVVLGGGTPREILAARISRGRSNLPVIVSSGSPLPCLYRIFSEDYGIPWKRVSVDFRATDTFTNLTAISSRLRAAGHRYVILITSEKQRARVRALATVILGGQGIVFQTTTLVGGSDDESLGKTLLDGLRAAAWLVFGDAVARPFYHPPAVVDQREAQRVSRCLGGKARIPDRVRPAATAAL